MMLTYLSHDIWSESVITSFIKNDNALVEYLLSMVHNIT